MSRDETDKLLTMGEAKYITGHQTSGGCRQFLEDLGVPLLQTRKRAWFRVWRSDLSEKLTPRRFHGETSREKSSDTAG